MRVLNRLLEAGDLGANFVEPPLNLVKRIAALALTIPALLNLGFEFSLLGNNRFESRLSLSKLAIGVIRPVIKLNSWWIMFLKPWI